MEEFASISAAILDEQLYRHWQHMIIQQMTVGVQESPAVEA
ncbi:MAG: hypothetical protein ABH870_06450 [bacterium]